MGYKNKYLFGLTLMEVVISTIILAVILAGMAGLFTSSRKWLTYSRSKMAGAELSRVFLSPLHMQVRQDTWGEVTNALYPDKDQPGPITRYCDQDSTHLQMPGNFCQPLQQTETTLFGMPFEAQYDLDTVPNTTVRRVRVTIRWTEKGP